MAEDRRSPLVARNFSVRLVLHGPRGGHGGDHEMAFSHVVMPPFRLDERGHGKVPEQRDDGGRSELPPSPNLLLRRGHTGSDQLYDWWRAERDRERFRVREVAVTVLDEQLRPVTAWHFTGCRIVSLDYSPLDAVDAGVLMETLELSFTAVDQVDRGG